MTKTEGPDNFNSIVADALDDLANVFQLMSRRMRRLNSEYGDALVPNYATEAIAMVARAFGVSVSDVLSSARNGEVPKARHQAMWVLREAGELSFPVLGRIFYRDSATVISACRKISQLRERDPETRERLDRWTRVVAANRWGSRDTDAESLADEKAD